MRQDNAMLTISQIARLYKISNRQVQDLVDCGYLTVADLQRSANQGITYLFSEEEISQLDIYSLLAEMRDNPGRLRGHSRKSGDFKRLLRVMNHYDRFLEEVSTFPEGRVLEICFYLFHLNHYAKTYQEQSKKLYHLKKRVLRKLYGEGNGLLQTRYLLGQDRQQIWLCEDCKDSANAAGLSYVAYLRQGYYCPKCEVQALEKEYYSLFEFQVDAAGYRFTFHLPRSAALRWIPEPHKLPQDLRAATRYDDSMYLYGRRISRIEEKAFPLDMIVEKLNHYLNNE